MNSRKLLVTIFFLILATSLSRSADGPKTVEMFVGATTALKFSGLSRLAVGDPGIADVTTFPENPDEILINAKKPGATTLTVWDASADSPFDYEILVSNPASQYEQRTFTLKYYPLTYTEYNDAGRKIETKPDQSGIANLEAVLKPLLGEGGYSIDVGRNRVMMKGTKSDLDAASAALSEIDKPLRQVLIEAKVIEITKDDLVRLGNKLIAERGRNSVHSDMSGDAPSFVAAFDTFTDLAKRFNITMDMLRTEQVGRTLVNTRVAVLDGRTAWILSGEKIPIATRDSQQGLVSYSYISTGIGLAVSPRVGYDNTITLWIRPEVSNISGWVGDPESAGNNAAPIIDTREVMTEVRVEDGGTIFIGGLQKDEEITSKSKVPFLGDLPLIGSFFRKKRTSTQTTELVIVITPRIMKNNEAPDLTGYGMIDLSDVSGAAGESGNDTERK